MKYFLFLAALITAVLFSCNHSATNKLALQQRIDSLDYKLAHTYKPGFGEFMTGVQTHHAKLWFAGQNQNWELAGFEINEIKESINGIREYCTDRYETGSIGIIDPAMDSISSAIQHKSLSQFKSSYVLLTNTCNECHRATSHAFNVIKIPDTPPFSNQDFKAGQ